MRGVKRMVPLNEEGKISEEDIILYRLDIYDKFDKAVEELNALKAQLKTVNKVHDEMGKLGFAHHQPTKMYKLWYKMKRILAGELTVPLTEEEEE